MDGRQVSLAQVHAWEKKRTLGVLRKLGVPERGGELAELRHRLLARKRELGNDRLRAMLGAELSIADRLSEMIARLSRGRRRFCAIEILSSSGRAQDFARWFDDLTVLGREEAMQAAAPEHYVLTRCADGRQEVIETNGGSPMAARFFIDYRDLSTLRSGRDPSYEHQSAGVAFSRRGVALGGVRHQFRNEGPGYRARLLVEFPLFILPGVVSGHRWHLACEFSNWMTAFAQESAAAMPARAEQGP